MSREKNTVGVMSIQVEPDELGDALRVYRFAYLITVGNGPRSHVVAVSPALDGGQLVVSDLGRRTVANLAVNPMVTLVWPPAEAGGYSLIVDGHVDGASPPDEPGGMIRVTVGRAVLHRPAPNPAGPPETGCAADCVELPVDRQSLSGAK